MTHSHSAPVIDVDDLRTWPRPLTEFIEQLIAGVQLRNLESRVPLHVDDRARGLLAGSLVRAHHCTRLLDYEADAIRAQGLRMLDTELLTDRIRQAQEQALITPAQRERFEAYNGLSPKARRMGRREGQVCLTLSTGAMLHHSDGAYRLLSYWGGEALYAYFEKDPDLAPTLRSLGRPTLITALIDLSDPDQHLTYGPLTRLLAAKALGDEEEFSDVFHRAPVPPEQIESLAHPGDPAYDRFPDLVRE